MTGDGSEHDGPIHEPGAVVQRTTSDIAGAADADAVATVAARAFERLLGGAVDCAIYDRDGDRLAASDGSARVDTVDLPASPSDGLSWPADPLVVPVAEAGWLVCWADSDGTAPEWAVRSIAAGAVDAACQRARRAEARSRIADLEAETEQLANFANIVAHDLRNPLAIAQGHLELARESDADEHYEKIDEAHDRIQRIIDHTLTMAKQEGTGVETERVDTGAVAHDAWETVETGAATLTVSDSIRVAADRERLQQLFENLFRNAVEHGSPNPGQQARQDAVEHGVPEQRVEHDGDADSTLGAGLAVEVGTLADGTGFFVADNGPGIPESERSAVFDQGYSDDGGTGLGLSIIADIVEEHGWSVTVTGGSDENGDSNGQTGARFEFSDVA